MIVVFTSAIKYICFRILMNELEDIKTNIKYKTIEINTAKKLVENLKIDYNKKSPRLSVINNAEGLVDAIEKKDDEKARAILESIKGFFSVDHLTMSPISADESFVGLKETPDPILFPILDMKIPRGLNIIVGSYPGVGKSTFIANIVMNFLLRKKFMIFFSLEMTASQVWIKLFQWYLASVKNISEAYDMVEYKIRSRQEGFYETALEFAKEFKPYLLIIEKEDLTATQMVSLIDNSYNFFGRKPDLWLIDYIQLIDNEPKKLDSHRLHVAEISKILTRKSKHDQLNGIIASQLNDKGNYAEAANIERDCGWAIRLEREKDQDGAYRQGITINLLKNRYGPIKTLKLAFDNVTGVIG